MKNICPSSIGLSIGVPPIACRVARLRFGATIVYATRHKQRKANDDDDDDNDGDGKDEDDDDDDDDDYSAHLDDGDWSAVLSPSLVASAHRHFQVN